MMMNIGRRILAGYGLVVVLSAFALGVVLLNLTQVRSSFGRLAGSSELAQQVGSLEGAISDLLGSTREFPRSRSEENAATVEASRRHVALLAGRTQNVAAGTEVGAALEAIAGDVGTFEAGLDRNFAIQRERDGLLYGDVERLANVLRKATRDASSTAAAEGDAEDARLTAASHMLTQEAHEPPPRSRASRSAMAFGQRIPATATTTARRVRIGD